LSGCSTMEVSRVPSEANVSEGVSGPEVDVVTAVLFLFAFVIICYNCLKKSD